MLKHVHESVNSVVIVLYYVLRHPMLSKQVVSYLFSRIYAYKTYERYTSTNFLPVTREEKSLPSERQTMDFLASSLLCKGLSLAFDKLSRKSTRLMSSETIETIIWHIENQDECIFSQDRRRKNVISKVLTAFLSA